MMECVKCGYNHCRCKGFVVPAANKAAEEGGLPYGYHYEWASCITTDGPQGFKWVFEKEAPPEWAVQDGQARNVIPLFIAADRASRQVANKAEVEPVRQSLQCIHDTFKRDLDAGYVTKDKEFAVAIAAEALSNASAMDDGLTDDLRRQVIQDTNDTLREQSETMQALHNENKRLKDLLATPPATTGASTARDQAFEEAAAVCEKKYEARAASGHPREASAARNCAAEIRALKGSVGASTVLTDERTQFEAYVRKECDSEEYADSILAKNSGGFYHAVRIQGAWEGWQARSKVAAQAGQVAVPPGFAIVPTAINEDMHVAAVRAIHRATGNDDAPSAIWSAMISVAPSPAKESK